MRGLAVANRVYLKNKRSALDREWVFEILLCWVGLRFVQTPRIFDFSNHSSILYRVKGCHLPYPN